MKKMLEYDKLLNNINVVTPILLETCMSDTNKSFSRLIYQYGKIKVTLEFPISSSDSIQLTKEVQDILATELKEQLKKPHITKN